MTPFWKVITYIKIKEIYIFRGRPPILTNPLFEELSGKFVSDSNDDSKNKKIVSLKREGTTLKSLRASLNFLFNLVHIPNLCFCMTLRKCLLNI